MFKRHDRDSVSISLKTAWELDIEHDRYVCQLGTVSAYNFADRPIRVNRKDSVLDGQVVRLPLILFLFFKK